MQEIRLEEVGEWGRGGVDAVAAFAVGVDWSLESVSFPLDVGVGLQTCRRAECDSQENRESAECANCKSHVRWA